MNESVPIDTMIKLIEINLGKWKPLAVVIIDKTFKIWGLKGEFPEKALKLFEKYTLDEMKPGDSIHNGTAFLMKVTEKTAVIVEMNDVKLSIHASANLRGRINALSDFYKLEKFVINHS
nr:hypothetical protein [Candidatus Freyarchaeota archaeon]